MILQLFIGFLSEVDLPLPFPEQSTSGAEAHPRLTTDESQRSGRERKDCGHGAHNDRS